MIDVPGSAMTALAQLPTWWTCMCLYEDVQGLPATGGFFLPAAGEQFDPLLVRGEVNYVYIFEQNTHAHEFMDAFHEAHREQPKLQALWKFMKVVGLRPDQVVNMVLKHKLVPVQVRRDWAPAMFKLYREGHHKSGTAGHGPAIQFAVAHALEDYARVERERRV